MANEVVPEDLKSTYVFLLERAADNGGEWEQEDLLTKDLIERIAAAEADNKRLRDALEACLKRMVDDGYHSDEVEQARAALQKGEANG